MSKKTTFWITLVIGLIVVSVAVYAISKMMMPGGDDKGKPAATSAQVEISDGGADAQSRADRLTLGEVARDDEENASSRDDGETSEDSRSSADEDKKKAADEEKVKIDGEDSASGTSSDKVIVTTDDSTTTATTKKKTSGDEDLFDSDAQPAQSNQIFRLQLGKFSSEENARKLAADVKASTGLDMYVGSENAGGKMLYRVQGGAFGKKENAESYARELELKGYKVYVSTENKK